MDSVFYAIGGLLIFAGLIALNMTYSGALIVGSGAGLLIIGYVVGLLEDIRDAVAED